MRKQFKQTIMDLSQQDDRIVMLLGDVSVYLFREFQEKHPKRFYNVGICENTMVTMAAGLSSLDFVPFVHTITPFITERCYEQIKLDLCYNQHGANVVSCGASFDYAWDGATHHSYTDLAILRMLPNMEVMQPGSQRELDILLRDRYRNDKAKYYRLSDHPHDITDIPVEFGKGAVLKDKGAQVTVVTAGPLLGNVMEACRDLNVNLLYFHTLKPMDTELISRFSHTDIFVVHDAHGLYEAIQNVPNIRATYYGLPDAFCSWYGTLNDIRQKLGLDATSIRQAIVKKIEGKS